MKVSEFLDQQEDFDSLSQKDQVKLLSYFFCTANDLQEFTSAEIRKCFENENLSMPANVTHELNRLNSQKPQILNKKDGVYSFHRTARKELDVFYLNSGESVSITKNTQEGSIKATEQVHIGVITASSDEFNSIKSLLSDVKIHDTNDNDSISYYTGYLSGNGKQFSVVLPYPLDMGISPAVISTTRVIANFRPQYLFMIGIAAGNRNTNNVGDILIAEKSLNYSEVVEVEKKDKTALKKFMQNQDSINKHLKTKLSQFADSDLIEDIKSNYPERGKIEKPLKCSIGLLVTGGSLVRSQTKVDEINQSYLNVIGLDMETSGFYYASANGLRQMQPIFVSIKSVSDFGDNTSHKLSSEERRKYALFTSARAFQQFTLHYLNVPAASK